MSFNPRDKANIQAKRQTFIFTTNYKIVPIIIIHFQLLVYNIILNNITMYLILKYVVKLSAQTIALSILSSYKDKNNWFGFTSFNLCSKSTLNYQKEKDSHNKV